MSGRDPGPPPPRWLHCPRKSGELVAGKFLAFKTPLDSRFDPQVEPQFRFTPSMIFDSMKSYKVEVGLWVDLCNTSRFYSKDLVQERCKYVKLQCRGHGETPSTEQVATFNRLCQNFIQQNPLGIVAVHCTHGFNRTGFLIACCLIEVFDWSPEAAVAEFTRARPPGIYKEHYIQEIFSRYGDVSDAPVAPPLPDWCFEEDGEPNEDDEGNAINNGNGHSSQEPGGSGGGGGGGGGGGRRRELNKKNPQFMPGVPGVTPVTDSQLLQQIQRRVQDMCEWRK